MRKKYFFIWPLLVVFLFQGLTVKSQELKGYLGKKQHLQFSLGLAPSIRNPNVIHPNEPFNLGLNLKYSVQYGYILTEHFMLIGKLSYSRTHVSQRTMNYSAYDNQGSGPFSPENSAKLDIGELGMQARWHTKYFAPVGAYFGLGASIINSVFDGSGMDYPDLANKNAKVFDYEKEKIIFYVPEISFDFGLSRIFNQKYIFDIGFEVSGVITDTGRLSTIFSRREGGEEYETHRETLEAAAKGRLFMHEVFMTHIGFGIIF